MPIAPLQAWAVMYDEAKMDNETKSEVADSEQPCVVCCERPGGKKLVPCGHDCFCDECAKRFRLCPLCRAPLIPSSASAAASSDASSAATQQRVHEQPRAASESEMKVFASVWVFVWAIIFIGGILEFYADLPASCTNCDLCSEGGCQTCEPGFVNGGALCVESLEDLPPIRSGGALGNISYLVLIVLTQLFGCFVEVTLITRLHRLGLLPQKELCVLVSALMLEVVRIVLIDTVMLQQYFSDRSYSIFRVPDSEDLFFIASSRDAFSDNTDECSVFKNTSAVLDFDEGRGFGGSGYNRFSRLGWVVGGQFGLIYFFATFVNEVADIIFVVPTSTAFGWQCKAFAVSLEFFQLGALCAAAIFTHRDCLHYTDPAGVPLHAVRQIVVANCFLVWAFMLTCIPLAVVGAAIVAVIGCLSGGVMTVFVGPTRAGRMMSRMEDLYNRYVHSMGFLISVFLSFACVPTLLCGLFLGFLVIVGQMSKKGFMEVLTAIVLLSDVVFKVTATIVTEVVDFMLHVRVRRAVAQRTLQGAIQPHVVGQPID